MNVTPSPGSRTIVRAAVVIFSYPLTDYPVSCA